MKKILGKWLLVLIVMMAGVMGCEKHPEINDIEVMEMKKGAKPVAEYNCANYMVYLEHNYVDGVTIFQWQVYNVNPGNGSRGTTQDLSNISFQANGCDQPGLGLEDLWSDVLEMAYNTGDGWVIIPTVEIKPNPSIRDCTDENVFKYDVGTYKSAPTWYRLVLDGKWEAAPVTVWFKSGNNTGCCSQTVLGVGCRVYDDEFCSYSQGYYFAKPGPTWPDGEVTIGGWVYTEEEGRAIWNTSNAGGIADAKKAFTQTAAIKLSGVEDPLALEKVAIIEAWLSNLQKLTPTHLPNQTGAEIALYGNAAQAAGWIGDWINQNHCDDR